MSRPAGLPKTGGRKKGTPNKNSLLLLDRLQLENFDVVDELLKILPKLDTEKRANVLLSLLTYIYPKRSPLQSLDNSAQDTNYSLEFIE